MNKEIMKGELCVVTGAAAGIGRAIAERFLEEGADLIVADFNVEEAKRLYGENPHVLDILKVNATDIADLERLGEAVKKTGRKVRR